MNDLITAATSGLFVEVGKVIEHMKVQQERIADLERQLAEASAPAVEQQPGKTDFSTPRVDAMKKLWGDDGATRGAAYICMRDLAEELEHELRNTAPQAADIDKVREAILALKCGATGTEKSKFYVAGFDYAKCLAAGVVDSMAAQAPVR